MTLPVDPQSLEAAAQHVIDIASSSFGKALAAKTVTAIPRMLKNAFRKNSEGDLDQQDISLRVERLEEALPTLMQLLPSLDQEMLEQELHEPTTQETSAYSLDAIIGTRSAFKRKLFGSCQ